MNKRRQSARLRRVWRWEGIIREINSDTVWIDMVPIDHEGPERWAE